MFHDSLTHLCITPAIEHDLPAVNLILPEQNGKYIFLPAVLHPDQINNFSVLDIHIELIQYRLLLCAFAYLF